MSNIVLMGGNSFRLQKIYGLKLWLDAADSSTIVESSGLVSSWNDKSGNGNNATQGSGAQHPATNASTQNNRNVVDFDGSDSMQIPSALYSIPNGSNTVFLVSQLATDGSQERVLSFTESGSGRNYVQYGPTAGDIRFASNTTGAQVANTGNNNTNFNIINCYRAGATQSISINGLAAATDIGGADESGIDGAVIGAQNSSLANPFTGSIAEVIIFGCILSSTQVAQVETYLSKKWGISI